MLSETYAMADAKEWFVFAKNMRPFNTSSGNSIKSFVNHFFLCERAGELLSINSINSINSTNSIKA